MATPEQLEKELQQQKLERSLVLDRIQLTRQLSNTQSITELKGLDRINQTVLTKVESFKSKATQQILSLSRSLGIEGLTNPNPTLPNICPSPETLRQVLQTRDRLVADLQTVAVYINTVDRSLQVVSDLVNGTITTLTALNALKTATSIGTKFAPTVPGAVTALLADLDDIRTIITFNTDGSPRLPELKRGVDQGTQYVSIAAQTLNSIIAFLQLIDQVLQFCNIQTQSISTELLPTTNLETESTYKGFTFRIVEEPFTPTVNKKIGQALNKQGIVLLQTESSFTANPQVLIDELKFIIDRDNLKAN
jgi:hypothetical protein